MLSKFNRGERIDSLFSKLMEKFWNKGVYFKGWFTVEEFVILGDLFNVNVSVLICEVEIRYYVKVLLWLIKVMNLSLKFNLMNWI